MQPPSGGCVLKRLAKENVDKVLEAAAFGRLCVETVYRFYMIASDHRQPPSGGCVLKRVGKIAKNGTIWRAAAFGRLCVETLNLVGRLTVAARSRLRAAVC